MNDFEMIERDFGEFSVYLYYKAVAHGGRHPGGEPYVHYLNTKGFTFDLSFMKDLTGFIEEYFRAHGVKAE